MKPTRKPKAKHAKAETAVSETGKGKQETGAESTTISQGTERSPDTAEVGGEEGKDTETLGENLAAPACDPALRPWQRKFVEQLAKNGVIGDACIVAGCSRDSVRHWRERSRAFDGAVRDAIESAIDHVERKTVDIAANGTLRPVFQGGVEVGQIREWDTSLMQFVLRTRRRDQWGEKLDVNVTGALAHLHIPAPELSERVSGLLPTLAAVAGKTLEAGSEESLSGGTRPPSTDA